MKATVSVIPVLAVLCGSPAFAQSVISAQSGLINFTQGPVLVENRPVRSTRGQFPQMKERETLRTTNGRAELLLNPGVFLRVGENSAVRMVSGRLTDSRLELLSGTVVLEAAEVRKDSTVTLHYGDATVSVLKRGLYRLETDPARLRVFDGKARVESGGQGVEVGKGKQFSFDGDAAITKFNRKETDALDLWSSRRAAHLARVSMSTARSLRRGEWSRTNGWWWNPLYGAYTFMPLGGYAYSPYGYYFWNPRTVYQAYSQPTGGGGSYQGSSPSYSSGPSMRPSSSSSSEGGLSGGSISRPTTQSVPARPSGSTGGGLSGSSRR